MPIDIIQLHDHDNVAVAVREFPAGQVVEVAGASITLKQSIPLGHKIATLRIAAGEKVFKWGCPIGSATCDIAAGEHVHTHNLKSDYLPTFTQGAYVEAK